ncbi:hypothetical protein DM01DRAFT_1385794 [Hesseltinella vesiculosa]|uniref:Uncharacterized protein n=1 Tax=Hesseltinella vesiculosa TaxID=101127 RepID=A0A1X2G8K7_9FUNG|nr:hypothetical protein DM01DRAFT_1385794 [Hesseltinella vesiculosa]
MMGLASFPIVSQRWKRAALVHATYEDYPRLHDYMTPEVFQVRLDTIKEVIRTSYPQVWIDSYLFFSAIFLVIFAAVLSISLQTTSQDKSQLWYPLLILIGPAIIAFWTSRRRSRYYVKYMKFQEKLQKLLKELTMLDSTLLHIKWHERRPREDDSPAELHLPLPISQYAIPLVIDVIQVNPEDIARLTTDSDNIALPSYNAAIEDIVLDVGVVDPQQRHPNDEHDLGTPSSSFSYPLPPVYDGHGVELTLVNPPQYRQ